ncbi:hypothetical protein [Actinomadura sp. WMMB 499]|uniref:hypothetical protein n=1 Tax=Actinomadura sp. WMMB 499 TaxID=1219491 RepID=UPI001244FBF1|nr:hypothetical protein [Actinomadura sp. WMMB 499]QFG26510.1 hypothetical protein F7P10_40630 [Actinomadura sp. WMMB 499]
MPRHEWSHPLDRNAALTALTLAEVVITHDETDSCVLERQRKLAMVDRLPQIKTALAVVTVASVNAIISYRHAHVLAHSNREASTTARLVSCTVNGFI